MFFFELTEQDCEIVPNSQTSPLTLRRATRGFLVNENQELALLHVTSHDYFKLPGGGLKDTETETEALLREAIEETGARIQVQEKLGVSIEYRSQIGQLQISYYYHARVKGPLLLPQFTKLEVAEGFQPLWLPLSEAVCKVRSANPSDYVGRFVARRDYLALKYYQDTTLQT